MAKQRAIVYIDGFNLYYGLLRSQQYRGCKWLDLDSLFRRIRQHDAIERIKYFTAYWPDDSGKRHQVYVRALAMSPNVEVVLGRIKKRDYQCQIRGCNFSGNRTIYGHEEKQTDVNIALHMLDDATRCACDVIVLVSADSDLVPAIDLVKTRAPSIRIIVYIPGPHQRYQTAAELRTAAHEAKLLPANLLPKCQLPTTVNLAGGVHVTKPSTW